MGGSVGGPWFVCAFGQLVGKVSKAVWKEKVSNHQKILIHNFLRDRPYIKYVGGVPEGFCRGLFRHIMMDHEIFLEIFDGPPKNFLFVSFVIFFIDFF